MKIIREDCAYVQKHDIAYLNQTDLPVLASIYMKVFGNGVTIIDDKNRYEFFKFDGKDEIEFFKNIDWMIDYDEVKELNEDEILSLGQSIIDERNRIVKRFKTMSKEEKTENTDLIIKCEMLDFKMLSLRDFGFFKQGRIKMELPEGIEYPIGMKREKSGFEKRIKAIFKKKKTSK